MALWYVYFFALSVGDQTEIKAIYAFSEKRARQKFEKEFNKPAGELIKRDRW